jgi:acetyltransferase-like isoleucine patch superfamily enzyme
MRILQLRKLPGAALDALWNRLAFAVFGVECAEFPSIVGRVHFARLAPNGRVRLGRGVVINSGFEANPVGGWRTAFVINGPGALIEVGDGAAISNAVFAAMTRITVGKGVHVGAGARIFDNDFHSLDAAERAADTGTRSAPVVLKDRCFIGGSAIILKGVTVGEEAVVGAGAVVTRDVPDREVWAGNPARCVRAAA